MHAHWCLYSKVVCSLPSVEPNRDMLTRSGFFDRFGKEWLFPSLQDAVNHAEMGVRLVSG